MPLDVRPLPLHRSADMPLTMLAGVAGALYAAPAGLNGTSQRRWDNVETNGLTEVRARVFPLPAPLHRSALIFLQGGAGVTANVTWIGRCVSAGVRVCGRRRTSSRQQLSRTPRPLVFCPRLLRTPRRLAS